MVEVKGDKIEIIKDRDRLFEKFCKRYGEQEALELFARDPGGIFDDPIIVNEPSEGQSQPAES